MIAPDVRPLELQVGTKALPAFSGLVDPEPTAPLAAWLCGALAATLELAAALAVALALTDSFTEEVEEVTLLPPIPGLSPKETSLARSPHRASRASYKLYQIVERETYLRRKVGYRSNKSF